MSSNVYSSAYDAFRELLKELREGKQFTQAELAARIGVPQSYVSKYETGERRLDFVETREVCRALGCSTLEFAKTFERRIKTHDTEPRSRNAS